MSIGTKKTHTCSFTGRKRAGSSEGQNVKALQTNLHLEDEFSFAAASIQPFQGVDFLKYPESIPLETSFSNFWQVYEITTLPLVGEFFDWHRPQTSIYINVSSRWFRNPAITSWGWQFIPSIYQDLYIPMDFFHKAHQQTNHHDGDHCRLYDWFSEYRLRAAGREDILEKAKPIHFQFVGW